MKSESSYKKVLPPPLFYKVTPKKMVLKQLCFEKGYRLYAGLVSILQKPLLSSDNGC